MDPVALQFQRSDHLCLRDPIAALILFQEPLELTLNQSQPHACHVSQPKYYLQGLSSRCLYSLEKIHCHVQV